MAAPRVFARAWPGLWAYVWAAPCTLLGLALAAIALPFGARWQWHSGVLEVALRPSPPKLGLKSRWPFAAITLGHVVLACDPLQMQCLREHERAHVAQYERWGVVFLLAYPLSSLVQLVQGRRPYFDNHFEVQARAMEARGRVNSEA
jgi:hypothetical protein